MMFQGMVPVCRWGASGAVSECFMNAEMGSLRVGGPVYHYVLTEHAQMNLICHVT